MPKIADFFVELGLKKDKFDKGMDEAGRSPSKLSKSFAVAGAAIAAAYAAVGIAAIAFSKQAMQAYDKQAKAEAALLRALNGRKDVQQALITQASQLQRVTLYGDEQTVEAQKMLAVMGLSATQIKDLIPLVQDFATAMGMDLTSAANLVGKAVGTGTNALGRYGIELNSTMSQAEKAIAIQEKFTKMFGGQAKTAADVGMSGLTQLKNAWGDIMELVGARIGPAMNALAKILSGKMLDTMGGDDLKGSAKDVNDYLNADKEGRERLVNQLKFSEKLYLDEWKKAKDEQNDAASDHYSTQYALVKESLQKIAELEKSTTVVTTLTQDERREAWERTTAKIREQNELIELSNDLIRNSIRGLGTDSAVSGFMTAMYGTPEQHAEAKRQFESFAGDLATMIDQEISEEDPAWLTKLGEDLMRGQELTQQFGENVSAALESMIEESIAVFAEGIGRMAAGEIGLNEFFSVILDMFGGFVVHMGKLLIAYGVSMEAFKKAFKNPWAAIIAGAALVAIGSAISSLAAKGPGGGGGTSSVGMAGSGGGGYTNMPMQGGEQTLSVEVAGDSLLFILERASRNRGRVI